MSIAKHNSNVKFEKFVRSLNRKSNGGKWNGTDKRTAYAVRMYNKALRVQTKNLIRDHI